MITSLFSGLNKAVRSLQAAQHSITVHGSNIAHANDKNYTRRDPMPFAESVTFGPGVVRLRDSFVDAQYRLASGSAGDAQVRQKIMSRVEDVFGDPVNGGLRKALDQFFDAWQGVAENPGDGVSRLQVLAAASTFAEQIQSTYRKLSDVEQTVNEDLITRVDEVNTLTDKIFDLNKRISSLHRNEMDDATVRDQRDVALDRLAQLTGAKSFEQEDGTVRVVVGPTVIVEGPTVVKLQLTAGATGPNPTWIGYMQPTYAGTGEIAGLVTVRDVELAELKQDIDSLGRTVATEVNNQHAAGFAAGGIAPPAVFLLSLAPADITLNPALTASNLGVAGDAAGLPSDGDNARLIAQIAEKPVFTSIIIPGQTQAPRTYYRNLIGWVGNHAQDAQLQFELSDAHVKAADQQRQSMFGVSIDEEVANLTMQQKAYAAAARVISIMDEMMDTLINRTLG
ncbi:MAG TPA: flagellar hook-associated protein FlgK [Symbiobacteriaceae bacterium]|nr:flagellar hook-associated protein FlgK [Symbiobacteriaceae bacterium]